MLILGWITASLALCFALLLTDCLWNMFDWNPQWDARGALYGFGVLTMLVAIWFLARATRDKVSLTVSFIVCLMLVGLALYAFDPEPTTAADMPAKGSDLLGPFFVRHASSPLWYREARLVLMTLPGMFWFVWLMRNRLRLPPNKSPEPTAVGTDSSAVAVHVASRRWLSFFR